MGSSRLPGKVLLPLRGKSVLERLIERVSKASYIDHIVVATTIKDRDQPIVDLCKKLNIGYYKGSEKIISVCEKICSLHSHVEFILIENMSHEQVMTLKKDCDILIDQIDNKGGWGYGMNSIEAMAVHTCCLTEMNVQCETFFSGHPFVNINKNNLGEKLLDLVLSPEKIDDYKNKAFQWVSDKHDVEEVGKNLYKNYNSLLNE